MNIGEKVQKQEALKKVEEAYNDRNSPHYRDNERYSWAVKTINEKFKNMPKLMPPKTQPY
jgi:hypothetical protein